MFVSTNNDSIALWTTVLKGGILFLGIFLLLGYKDSEKGFIKEDTELVSVVDATVTKKEYKEYKEYKVELTYISENGTVVSVVDSKDLYENYNKGEQVKAGYYASSDRKIKELKYKGNIEN